MALKLDMERAYDIIRVDFLEAVMKKVSSPTSLWTWLWDASKNRRIWCWLMVGHQLVHVHHGLGARQPIIVVPFHLELESIGKIDT